MRLQPLHQVKPCVNCCVYAEGQSVMASIVHCTRILHIARHATFTQLLSDCGNSWTWNDLNNSKIAAGTHSDDKEQQCMINNALVCVHDQAQLRVHLGQTHHVFRLMTEVLRDAVERVLLRCLVTLLTHQQVHTMDLQVTNSLNAQPIITSQSLHSRCNR